MSLHTIKGGNTMEEKEFIKDVNQKGLAWRRIANKKAVMIMIMLHDCGGSATLSEISEKKSIDKKTTLLKLKELMYYGIIDKEDDKYTLSEKGEKVLSSLLELAEMVRAKNEFV
jgi:predicted transcriptional regulator